MRLYTLGNLNIIIDAQTHCEAAGNDSDQMRESNSLFSVMDTVTSCVAEVLSISEREAKARMAEIVVAGKYLQDVWT